MELREFVRDVLVQVAGGVRDADAAVFAVGGVASPATRSGPAHGARETHFATLESGAPVFLVDFDVAVTVSETTGKEAGAQLRIATVFSAGGGIKDSESTASVNRVRFKVPLALPVNADSAQRVKEANDRARAITNQQGRKSSWMES